VQENEDLYEDDVFGVPPLDETHLANMIDEGQRDE